MPYAIARIAKLKAGNIAGSGMHVDRSRKTSNANPKIANVTLIHHDDRNRSLTDIVNRKIDETPQLRKIRTDAVYCVELLLTASPNYFRPDTPDRYGHYEPAKLDPWVDANVRWLQQQYQDRIVRAELHLDEATPHIHAYLVPLDDRGQLNCKSIFGGREKLRAFQDSYHQAVDRLGLERGVSGSQANHLDIKDFYTIVNQGTELDLELNLDRIQQLQTQAAAYNLTTAKNQQLERTLKLLTHQNSQLNQQLRDTKKTAETQDRIYRTLTDRVPPVPLSQIAYELGLKPDLPDLKKWRQPGTNREIEIAGAGFYDWQTMKGGLGAIDLVMSIQQTDFHQAVNWLTDQFGEAAALQLTLQQTQQMVVERPQEQFIPPIAATEHWAGVREVLMRERQLPIKLIDRLHSAGQIYADGRQHLVCLNRSLTGEVNGATVVNPEGDDASRQLADDSRRSQGWFYLDSQGAGNIYKVVLLDSPLEVLAYVTLHPSEERMLYLAVNDSGWVPEELKNVGEMVVATKTELHNLPPKVDRHLPKHGIWGEDLRDYLAGVQVELVQKQSQERTAREQAVEKPRGLELGG
jgi:Plasmid recombination enzyme